LHDDPRRGQPRLIGDEWLRRGTHHSVRNVASIVWITGWNDNPKPIIWHNTIDEILDNLAAHCLRISHSGH